MSDTPRTDRNSFPLSSGREVTDAECSRELERENAEITEMLLAATMYPAEQRDGLVWHGFTTEFDARVARWRAKLRAKK